MKNDNISNINSSQNCSNSFSDCHRTQNNPQPAQTTEADSEQDSSTSKYVVQNDNRERRDGPGGN